MWQAREWRFGLMISVLTVLLLGYDVLSAQQDSGHSVLAPISEDVTVALHDVAYIATAPLHFSADEWIQTAAIVGTTAICFSFDESARTFMGHQQSEAGDVLAR